MAGYFLVERDIFDHPLFDSASPFSKREAWLWTIAHANFQPGVFRDGGTVHAVPRGSLATRYRALERAWKWSVNRVKRELELWEKQKMVLSETEQGFVLVTVCNYDAYQCREKVNGTAAEHERNGDGTATDTKQKKEKKETNTTPSYSPAFEEWYRAYPLKKGKQAAYGAYLRALGKVSHDVLMATARLWAAECGRNGTEQQFIAHPSTWLNEERWHNHRRDDRPPAAYSRADLGL